MTERDEKGATCCLCGWSGRAFLPFNGIDNRVCPECRSLERQRAVGRLLSGLDLRGVTVLEVAPLTGRIFGGFFRGRGAHYVSFDRWRRGNPHDPRDVSFVDLLADVSSMPFGAGVFDWVLAQHVLCQVPDDRSALREIARVLKPGGTAIIEFPYIPGQACTQEYDGPREWGNYRRYGEDVRGMLAGEGFAFEERTYELGSFFLARPSVR